MAGWRRCSRRDLHNLRPAQTFWRSLREIPKNSINAAGYESSLSDWSGRQYTHLYDIGGQAAELEPKQAADI